MLAGIPSQGLEVTLDGAATISGQELCYETVLRRWDQMIEPLESVTYKRYVHGGRFEDEAEV